MSFAYGSVFEEEGANKVARQGWDYEGETQLDHVLAGPIVVA